MVRPNLQQCFQVRPANPQTHLAVAAAVASGVADVDLGILPAAAALGLDFIPLTREMFDLVILEESVGEASLTRLIEVVASGEFRRRLAALGGHDTSVSDRVE